jgi:hypothetical protein
MFILFFDWFWNFTHYLDRNALWSIIKRFLSSGLLYLYQLNDTGYDDWTWHSKITVLPPFSVRFFNVFIHCIFVDDNKIDCPVLKRKIYDR